MCTTMLAVTTAVTLAAGMFAAETERQTNKYNAQFILEQAKQTKKAAITERQEGIEEAREKKLQAILDMNREKAKFAANNISLSSQTVINNLDDEKLNGEMNALTTLKKSNIRADLIESKAQKYYQNAALTSYKANNQFIIKSSKTLISATKDI